jgi:hypothetical protein
LRNCLVAEFIFHYGNNESWILLAAKMLLLQPFPPVDPAWRRRD